MHLYIMCSGVSYRNGKKRRERDERQPISVRLIVDHSFDARADAFGVQVFAHIARAAQQGVVDCTSSASKRSPLRSKS